MPDTLLMTSIEHYCYMLEKKTMLPIKAVVLQHGSNKEIAEKLKRQNLKSDIPCFGSRDLDCICTEPELRVDVNERHTLTTTILNSCIPFFLLDRSRGRFPATNFLQAHRIDSIIGRSIHILKQFTIERIISCSTPHAIEFYVFAKVAELLGIKVLIVETSPILHRYWHLEGLGPRVDREKSTATLVDVDRPITHRTLEFISKLQSPGSSHEKLDLEVQMKNYKSLTPDVMSELRANWAKLLLRPHLVFHMVKKVRLVKIYESLCTKNINLKRPYIIYFLHYQPERTSLPEGGIFVFQHLAIRLLAEKIPEGWKVYVREHPSTWIRDIGVTARDSNYYNTLSRMTNVSLVGMDVSTNGLIDNARAVATLTGKVGIQAIFRGKPAIAFGKASYYQHPLCYSVTTVEDLERALACIQADESSAGEKRLQLEEYLRWIESVSTEAPATGANITSELARFEGLRAHITQILESPSI